MFAFAGELIVGLTITIAAAITVWLLVRTLWAQAQIRLARARGGVPEDVRHLSESGSLSAAMPGQHETPAGAPTQSVTAPAAEFPARDDPK